MLLSFFFFFFFFFLIAEESFITITTNIQFKITSLNRELRNLSKCQYHSYLLLCLCSNTVHKIHLKYKLFQGEVGFPIILCM